MAKNKVAIVDDHALFNAGIKDILRDHPDYEVVAAFTTGQDFVEWLKNNEVDVLITDLSMPEMGGMEIIKIIRKASPKTKVLVVSSISNEYSVKKCFLLGANGYLPKTLTKEDLLEALSKILEDKYYLAAEVHDYLIQGVLKDEDLRSLVLTNREMEIIQLICNEYSSKQISEELKISEFTVSNHRKSILSKLGVRNVAGIIKYAMLNGLV